MSLPNPKHIQEWRAYARQDWKRMLLHLAHSDPSAAGLFLEQAVEKYLKGYLLARGWPLNRTHALPLLLAEATRHDSALSRFLGLTEHVADYYFVNRYPESGAGLPSSDEIQSDAREAQQLIVLLFPDEALDTP